MFGKPHTDALVAGAGPVGLFAALLLAQHQIGCQIIDEEWRAGAHSYALALHPASLDLLDSAGVLSEILAAGRRIDRMAFYDGSTRAAELDFSRLHTAHPYLLAIGQNVLEETLLRHLQQHRLDVQWEHRLANLYAYESHLVAAIDELGKESGGYATASEEWVTEATRGLEAAFILGADGHASKLRRLLEIPFDSAGDAEFYAIFEFHTPDPLPDEVRVIMAENHTDVLWPLPGNRARWSLQLSGLEIPRESRIKSRLALQVGSQIFPYLTKDDLIRLINERAPWFTQSIGEVYWSLAVRFERSLAHAFGHERAYLAGDAAHLTGPIGVQSLNAGLQEAHDLVLAIDKVLHQNAPLHVLEETTTHHRHLWRQLLNLDPLLTPSEHTPPWIRQRLPRFASCLPAVTQDHLNTLAR